MKFYYTQLCKRAGSRRYTQSQNLIIFIVICLSKGVQNEKTITNTATLVLAWLMYDLFIERRVMLEIRYSKFLEKWRNVL